MQRWPGTRTRHIRARGRKIGAPGPRLLLPIRAPHRHHRPALQSSPVLPDQLRVRSARLRAEVRVVDQEPFLAPIEGDDDLRGGGVWEVVEGGGDPSLLGANLTDGDDVEEAVEADDDVWQQPLAAVGAEVEETFERFV